MWNEREKRVCSFLKTASCYSSWFPLVCFGVPLLLFPATPSVPPSSLSFVPLA